VAHALDAVHLGPHDARLERPARAVAREAGFNAPQLNQTDGRDQHPAHLVAEYRRNFGPHTVGILGGIERQTADSSYVNAFRRDFVSDQVDQIFAGSDLGKTNDGTAYVAARQTTSPA